MSRSRDIATGSSSRARPIRTGESNGATLTLSGGTYTYTARDGTVATFQKYASNESVWSQLGNGNEAYATQILEPDGERLTFIYDTPLVCEEYGGGGDLCLSYKMVRRLSRVTNASGYVLALSYAENDLLEPWTVLNWVTRTGVKAVNRAVEACNQTNCSTTNVAKRW